MQEKNYTGIIPGQEQGVSIDTHSSIDLDNEAEAKIFYQVVKQRLLDVNNWHAISEHFTADFQLMDEQGGKTEGDAKEGCYFKINIPGPGSSAGDGYDWVKIEAVEHVDRDDVESTGIRVRPTDSPWNDKDDIAHFYSRESTSSFTITREGSKITAAIYDRNTMPNTEVSSLGDKIRDAVTGVAGIVAFSKLQWKSLADGLIKR